MPMKLGRILLWSMVTVLMAGLLASCGFHRKKYENPITKDTQQPDKKHLVRLLGILGDGVLVLLAVEATGGEKSRHQHGHHRPEKNPAQFHRHNSPTAL